jgi:hypothetical protein
LFCLPVLLARTLEFQPSVECICSKQLSCVFCFQSFLKHKDARPLRDVLAANPNRFVTLLLPGGAQAAVRPGSPSTSTLRLDLQFQAIKVASPYDGPEIPTV